MRSFALAGLLTALAPLAGCHLLIRPPELTIAKLNVAGLSLTGTTLDAVLLVGNPNFYTIRTTKVSYTLILEGQQASQGVVDKAFEVPGGGTAELVVPVKLSWSTALGTLKTAMDRGEVNARTEGIITADTMLGPVEVPFVAAGKILVDDGKDPEPAPR